MIQILHFFLRHLILVGFLAYLGLGFYFHEKLFPGQQLPSLSVPAKDKQAEVVSPSRQQTDVAAAVEDAQIQDPAAVSAPVEAPIATEQKPEAAPESADQSQAPVGFQFRPEEGAVANPEDAQYQNLMNQARTLTDREDWPGAEAAYLRLVLEYPDKAEPYGELGNLYLYRQDKIKAADAYWQAALRLKGEDQALRLQGLLEVLEQIDPDKAKSLREQVIKP
jgi:tetratricopeptide (TPR) repeat protein